MAVIGVKMGQPALGATLGAGTYIISWFVMGLGIMMAGSDGVQLIKDLRKKWFGAKNAMASPAAIEIPIDNQGPLGSTIE
jgi:hypothetical protein